MRRHRTHVWYAVVERVPASNCLTSQALTGDKLDSFNCGKEGSQEFHFNTLGNILKYSKGLTKC